MNQPDESIRPKTPTPEKLRKFLTIRSKRSTDSDYYEEIEESNFKNKYLDKEFVIKVLQLVIAIICLRLYTECASLLTNSTTNLMFPYVIYSTFFIITAVMVISYIAGHAIQDTVIRTFNTLAGLLYFISTAITSVTLIVGVPEFTIEEDDDDDEITNCINTIMTYEKITDNGFDNAIKNNFLLATTVFSGMNVFLYTLDGIWSIRRTLKALEDD